MNCRRNPFSSINRKPSFSIEECLITKDQIHHENENQSFDQYEIDFIHTQQYDGDDNRNKQLV